MSIEKSCGAVVFTKNGDALRFLLVRNPEGIYGFPKGHMEENETEAETALREIREETGLRVRFLPGFRVMDAHPLPHRPDVTKQIVYFLSVYDDDGQTPVCQREELSGIGLYAYEDAMALFQYESSRRILRQARDFLANEQPPAAVLIHNSNETSQ